MKKKRLAKGAFLAIGLAGLLTGCGGNRALVQNQAASAPASVITAPAATASAPVPASAHAEVNQPVADPDYQQAVTDANGATVSWRDMADYYTIAQYQYNHSDWADSLKTYQKI